MAGHALEVSALRVSLRSGPAIVDDLSLRADAGEVVGIVGESGSGKTTTALALLGYGRPGTVISGGSVRVADRELVGLSPRDLRSVRGRLISYVPQDPAAALNPSMRVSEQVALMARVHQIPWSADDLADLFARVGLPTEPGFARSYPHQLSGGQQQRVAIAKALVCGPAVVVLDEPTTGLDVITQAIVLAEIKRLSRESDVAIVYVSHDLAVVAQIAHRVVVMYAGSVIESAPTAELVRRPVHPYTRALIMSNPDHLEPRLLRGLPGVAVGVGNRPPGCAFAPRCGHRIEACGARMPALDAIDAERAVRCIRWRDTPALVREPVRESVARADADSLLAVESLTATYRVHRGQTVAVRDVSFSVANGECLALVGESGSGKTTIGRCIVGLHPPAAGHVFLRGEPLAARVSSRTRDERRAIQIVYQNPYGSLNPRHRVDDSVARAAESLRGLGRREARAEVDRLLEQVRLPASTAGRFPRELSGGECQRVALARALAARPSLLICDEITSALDVSVQAAVVELLSEFRATLGLTILFISHDLGLVSAISDRILVMSRGEVCEEGAVRALLTDPQDPYTQRLLSAAPRLEQEEAPAVGVPH